MVFRNQNIYDNVVAPSYDWSILMVQNRKTVLIHSITKENTYVFKDVRHSQTEVYVEIRKIAQFH